MKGFISRILFIILLLILPFISLIRGAVEFHKLYDLGPWTSLLLGIFSTLVILAIYRILAYGHRIFNKDKNLSFSRFWKISLFIIIAYCIHGLFFISSDNIKSSAVKKEINDLHPILRLSLSTIVLVDQSLIITDASRNPSDYKKMGLPTNNKSLHYKQKDGYAYATDLRTKGHSEFRNFLLNQYFRFMDFNTLRHTGTGDHLHISLYNHANSKRI